MVADTIALILVIIGALNWGAMGLFGIDILSTIFGGSTSLVARIVYSLIGIAGLWSITILFKDKVPQDTRE
jgi:uncharacterized membrane protein YuzA (DUF378 family)